METVRYIDISYPIDESLATYPGNPSFLVERVQDIAKGDSANVSKIIMGSHMGTHIDAPSHVFSEGKTIDQIPLSRMNGFAKVIDATGIGSIDIDFLRKLAIQRDDILIFRTDNSINWRCDRILNEYVTLTYESADYLSCIGVKMVGIDYLTIEKPRHQRLKGKSVHMSLLANDVLVLEALKLQNVHAGEYKLHCMPLNIKEMDGCPVRVVLIS